MKFKTCVECSKKNVKKSYRTKNSHTSFIEEFVTLKKMTGLQLSKTMKLKGGNMSEKISIEFTDDEYERIRQYMEFVEATTLQNAIMNAISLAMDHPANFY